MSKKTLLIDDDTSLLNTLERNLCLDFNVCTADGGQTGLEKLATDGPFAVVVVDMRMPGMDGIQTIQSLRAKQEDLVFIMLTGNQDSTTAIQAMNLGRVFRFLNKPCNMAEIKQAIQEALAEHGSKAQEKEMVLSTMRGSINVLTDLAAAHSENLATPNEISSFYELVLTTFALPFRAEDRMLCKLILVGAAALSESDRTKLCSASINSVVFHETFAKLCLASSQIVSNLPRFRPLAEILERTAASSKLIDDVQPGVQRPSALKIAFYWSVQRNRGGSIDSAIESLKNAFPGVTRDEWSRIEVIHSATTA